MAKNIAIFFDGTRNRLRARGGTNVFSLYEQAVAAGGTQRCLYLPGVGSERVKTVAIDALRKRASLGRDYHRINTGLLGSAVGALAGYGIGGRIKEAYAFIVDHYDEAAADQLFLFGFSRGAFSARSLAGFIGEVGLLFQHHLSKVPTAYDLYCSNNQREFLEKNYSQMIGRQVSLGEGLRVHMIGVWDTVGALGLPPPFQKIAYQTDHHLIHEMPRNVTHGRHALAMHELRSIFAPVRWKRSCKSTQSLKQVWFAGAHADVGGGYEDANVATTSLQWMRDEAKGLGLAVTRQAFLAMDTSLDIHHEIRGLFYFSKPDRRQLLVQLANGEIAKDDPDDLRSHSVHPSAVRRQDKRAKEGKAYMFRLSINAELDAIDAITRLAVIQTIEKCTERGPITDKGQPYDLSHQYGDQKSMLMRLLLAVDPNDPHQVNELAYRIVLTAITHGWNDLRDCLQAAIYDAPDFRAVAGAITNGSKLFKDTHLYSYVGSTVAYTTMDLTIG